MGKPKNEWAHELSGIVGKAGYTVISYGSENHTIRGDNEKEAENRTVVVLTLLPPQKS
jgi:hypothetical protein